METIGQILRNAREKRGLSIEDLEESTHIVAKFIRALENEDFASLPGEIYVKGFIKNLSDKLSLDSQLVLERYNLQKNGFKFEEDISKGSKYFKPKKKEVKKEEANPLLNSIETSKVEVKEDKKSLELKAEKETKEAINKNINNIEESADKVNTAIKNKAKVNKEVGTSSAEADLLFMDRRELNRLRGRRSIPVIPIIIVVAVLVSITVLFVNRNHILDFFFKSNRKRSDIEIARNIVNSKSKQNVKVGDVIYFKPLGVSATIKFTSIGNVVHLNINGQDLSFSKNNPIILDLNGNNINDFKISIVDVYDNLATVEMEKLDENQFVNNAYDVSGSNSEEYNMDNSSSLENNTIEPFKVINGDTYIESNIERSSIRVEITAKHFVYVRYFIDSDGPATTNLLSGKTIVLEARDVIMLTVGNAGEVVVKVNGKVVNVGANGETVNKTIKWIKNLNDSTKYNLIMSDTK